jgi:hypothetical protein
VAWLPKAGAWPDWSGETSSVATEKTVDAARHNAIGPKSLFLAKNNTMLPQIRDTQYIVFANKKPGASPFINSAYLYWFLSSGRA